jgi:hypothetical protein
MKFRDKDDQDQKYKKKPKHAGSIPGKGMKIINFEVLDEYDEDEEYYDQDDFDENSSINTK